MKIMFFSFSAFFSIFVSGFFSVFFSAFFFADAFAAPSLETILQDHQFFLKDAYLKNYDQLSGKNENGKTASVQKQTMEIVAERVGISVENVELLLKKTPILNCADTENAAKCEQSNVLQLKDLATVCPTELQEDLQKCWNELNRVYAEELERTMRLSFPLKKYSLSSEVFTNGTLADTGNAGFDVVVDLNIIDLILFGEKYSVPSSPSPFSRQNPKNFDPENLTSGTGVDYNNNNNQNNGNENCVEDTDENGNNENDKKNEDEKKNGNDEEKNVEEEMCIDPDALVFRKKNSNSSSNTSENSSAENTENQTQNPKKCSENIASENNLPKTSGLRYLEYTYRKGGEYPDFGIGNGTCAADEKPLLGGWICVPEFCTDLLCIKIEIIPGYRKVSLSDQNCVECHIDKANAALVELMGNLGRNTPNNSPVEPYFLTAFANLFRDVFDTITIKPKRLPFLVYDQSLTEQKKEKKNPTTPEQKSASDKKMKAHQKAVFLAQNKKLYDLMSHRCYPKSSPSVVETTEDFVEYCQKYSEDEKKYFLQGSMISSALEETAAQLAAKNSVKSQSFHKVVKPFFSQMSADMETINAHFYDIVPEIVQTKSVSCDYKKR